MWIDAGLLELCLRNKWQMAGTTSLDAFLIALAKTHHPPSDGVGKGRDKTRSRSCLCGLKHLFPTQGSVTVHTQLQLPYPTVSPKMPPTGPQVLQSPPHTFTGHCMHRGAACLPRKIVERQHPAHRRMSLLPPLQREMLSNSNSILSVFQGGLCKVKHL